MQSSVHETTPENEKLNIMINFDDVTGKNTEEQSPRWSQVFDHPSIQWAALNQDKRMHYSIY